MSKPIYLLNENGKASGLCGKPFQSESELQEIIAKNPQILLRETEEDNELYLVRRELTLPGQNIGETDLSLDHFMVDKQGIPVLVEVKKVNNPEIRRSVVGQMLEYAARISFYDTTELMEMFMLNNGMNSPAENDHDFWKAVGMNLRNGHMRLIFAADKIPGTLKAIIELLDRSMRDMDVYGVEITQYASDNNVYITTNVLQNNAKAAASQIASESEKSRWSDQDMENCLLKTYGGDWAYSFFRKFREAMLANGFTGKYGNGKTVVSYRFFWGESNPISFEANDVGAGIYFNSRSVEAINQDINYDALLAELECIDGKARYLKGKGAAHLRTTIRNYEKEENQEKVIRLIEKIAKREDNGSA